MWMHYTNILHKSVTIINSYLVHLNNLIGGWMTKSGWANKIESQLIISNLHWCIALEFGPKNIFVFAHCCVFKEFCSPLRKIIKPKQGYCISIDADANDSNTDKIHQEASLHHVAGFHGTVSKNYGIRSRGHRKSKCVATNNSFSRNGNRTFLEFD